MKLMGAGVAGALGVLVTPPWRSIAHVSVTTLHRSKAADPVKALRKRWRNAPSLFSRRKCPVLSVDYKQRCWWGQWHLFTKMSCKCNLHIITYVNAYKFVLSFILMLINLYCSKIGSVCMQLVICIQSILSHLSLLLTCALSHTHTLLRRSWRKMCVSWTHLKHTRVFI